MPKALGLMGVAMMMALAMPAVLMAQDSSYIKVPNADPEMETAKAQARASLGHFWERLANPGEGENGFAIKVALPSGANNTEHIWMKDVERKDGRISAVINNVPRDVKTVRLGERIEVAEPQISDWLYMRAGKMSAITRCGPC